MSKNLSLEGRRNAVRAQTSIISDLMNNNINYRSELERKGMKPKNHHRDNLNYIKNMQQHVKQHNEEQELQKENKNKRFLLPKFANIDSKVKVVQSSNKNLKQKSQTFSNESNINHILKNKENIKCLKQVVQSQNNLENMNKIEKMKRKANLPTRHELKEINEMIDNSHNGKENQDYIATNRKKMIQSHAKHNEKQNIRFVDKKDYGKVPEYIIQRRIEMAEQLQKTLEQKEKEKIPKGMRKMEEYERIETLKLLQENKKTTELAITKLPLTIETPSMIKHEKNLRNELQQIESAIKIFNKKVVLIAQTKEE